MIDGHTRLVGLIGWPVEHSLSPVMHNAAFDALGLNWRYVPLPVPPGQVEAAVRGLAALGFRGVNVTVPHKRVVMPVLDSLAANARELGAVNTLVIGRREDGSAVIQGCNTDDQGFVNALRHGGFRLGERECAVVVGAGGAARAVVFALLWSGIREIRLLNRSPGRAQALVSEFGARPEQASRLRVLPLKPETLVECGRAATLLVNATTVGMWPHIHGSIWPFSAPIPVQLAVFDLVYNPLETQLLRQARESGAHAIGGLGMLVEQGALAFEMWTGKSAPVEVMRGACERVLRR